MIKEYYFGSITIDGKSFDHDVEIRWTNEILRWRRKESHLIDVEDIKRAVEQSPEIIIIGIGESGVAQVTKEAQKFIREKGIELIIEITGKAVKSFNMKIEKEKVIGLFHLTC